MNRRDQPICTGTADDGTTTSMPLGNDPCTATDDRLFSNHTLSGTTHSSSSDERPRYLALSGVFRVAEDAVAPTIPAVESVAITSAAGSDREYVKDDVIAVTVTFSEAVTVTGTPRIKVKAHADQQAKNADYAEAGVTASELVFKYTVRAADYNYARHQHASRTRSNSGVGRSRTRRATRTRTWRTPGQYRIASTGYTSSRRFPASPWLRPLHTPPAMRPATLSRST